MKYIFATLAALFLLDSCSGGQTTYVRPVSKAESDAVHTMLASGNAPKPDSPIPTAATDTSNASCDAFIQKLRSGFKSDHITVPEDWSHPDDSKKIQVFYYWRHAVPVQGGKPTVKIPVVFFNGGPSSDSHSSSEFLESQNFTGQVPFIYIDQRGTGCSDLYPDSLDDATAMRLSHYGSEAIVRDAEAIRQKIFGRDVRWRIYGQSYGALIVHRYLEIAPEGVEKAIAHGFSIMSDPIQFTADRIASQQRVAGLYFETYPEDKRTLATIRSKIPGSQCWSDGSSQMCGSGVLDAMTLMLTLTNEWPTLHFWIKSLADADGIINSEILDKFVRTFIFGAYNSGGLAEPVITKLEGTPGYNDPDGCALAIKRLQEQGEDPARYDMNECRVYAGFKRKSDTLTSQIQASPIHLDAILDYLKRNPSFQFFLFSGQKDILVPYVTYDEEVSKLSPYVKYESFPNSGHEGFYSETDVTNQVIQ